MSEIVTDEELVGLFPGHPLNRDNDPGGLYRLRLEPVDGDLLVEWECGVLRVRTDGQLLWHRQYPCWADRTTITDGIIWYEPNDATAAPNQHRWRYRLSDGVAVPSEPERWTGRASP